MAETSKTEALARMAERLSARRLVGFVQTPVEADRLRSASPKVGNVKVGTQKVGVQKVGVMKQGQVKSGLFRTTTGR